MKKVFSCIILGAAALAFAPAASAQFNLGKAISGAAKATQALTISDTQIAEYARQSVEEMDKQNTVATADNPYSERLARLTQGITNADGTPLNFKVYLVKDINAFACPDGSVRVFSSLMDIMDDNELLGIIGHEVGHVAKHHSKKQFKEQLLAGALKDAIASTGGLAQALTDSQLAALGQSFASARYSQKQEKEADDYGYEFLKKNGKNPWGMVSAFEKMDALEAQSGTQASYLAKMFSSHPDTKERHRAHDEASQEGRHHRPGTCHRLHLPDTRHQSHDRRHPAVRQQKSHQDRHKKESRQKEKIIQFRPQNREPRAKSLRVYNYSGRCDFHEKKVTGAAR